MLEALVALGLVGNVIQIVQFSSDLLKQSVRIHESGAPPPLLEIQHITIKSLQQAEAVRTQLLSGSSGSQQLSEADQGTLNLIDDCLRVGNQLSQHIDSLLPCQPIPSRLQSLHQSFKIKFNRAKLDSYVQRLETLRSALSSDVVLSLIKLVGRHHDVTNPKLDRIQQDVRSIVASIEGGDPLGHEAPIIASGANNASEASITETIQRCMENIWKENRVKYPNSDMIYANGSESVVVNNTSLDGPRNSQRQILPLSRKEQGILKMLKFRQMTDRFEEISQACRRTFEWIFRPRSDATMWDSFEDYLIGNVKTLYWVNGKAASGKSTVMRYILEHDRFNSGLLSWSGSDELIVVSFFFWNLGTTHQKSRIGLLRAILFTIFEKHPELIRQAFPSLWEDWKASDENYEPSYTELKGGFLKLINELITGFKLCILVDGIDEFDGDHKELSLFLKGIASPRVKVVASSRPIPSCISTFGDCPTLRLQDLTRGDIKIFIEEHLYTNLAMKMLQSRHPDEAKQLVNDIRSKAAGVFLWVKLVVKLLIQGMENGDQVSDLQRRLNSLPQDLKELYERMFTKMDSVYQMQAAETFQIIRTWESMRPTYALSTLMLWHATTRPNDWMIIAPKQLSAGCALLTCKRTEAWIRSRCCGLVEVHENTLKDDISLINVALGFDVIDGEKHFSSKDFRLIGSTISYLHKSVAEFLYSKDIWDSVCKITANSKFDANASLARGSLHLLGSLNPYLDNRNPNIHNANPSLNPFLSHFTIFLRNTKVFSDREYLNLMAKCDETMVYLSRGFSCINMCTPYHHWAFHWLAHHTRGSGDIKEVYPGADLLDFAIEAGLHRFVRLERSNNPKRHMISLDGPLILSALNSWFGPNVMGTPRNLRKLTLEGLLQDYSHADPLLEYRYFWQNAIDMTCREGAIDKSTCYVPEAVDRGEFLKTLLLSGKIPAPIWRTFRKKLLFFSRKLQTHQGPFHPNPNREEEEDDRDYVQSLGQELERLAYGLEETTPSCSE